MGRNLQHGSEDRFQFRVNGFGGRIGFDAGVEFEIVEGGDDSAFEVFNGGIEGVECWDCGFFEVDGGCVGLVGGLGVVIVVYLH
jgi:hypothetical protein